MARLERTQHAPEFVERGDFNEQLYHALKKSPWWMISLAVHGLLYAISTLVAPAEAPMIEVGQVPITIPPAEPPPEVPPVEGPIEDPLKNVVESLVASTDPSLREVELAEKETTDNALPFDEALGNKGLADAWFAGPQSNALTGLGGGAGSAFGDGRGGHRNGGRGKSGRSKGTPDDAVEDALRWLAAHQSPDGGWEAEGFRRWCDGRAVSDGPDGAGKAQYDVGVTGLSLLAFLGAGYTNRSDGPFGKVVAGGLRYLRNAQDAEGCFGGRSSGHFVYNHAIAALAMVEAYGMTGSTNYKNPAQKALDFIAVTRNPYFAWRYGVKPGDNDTSVTGWMMMALKSARLVNRADAKAGRSPSLQLDEDAFDGIKAWVDKMTDPDTGRVGYQQRGSGPARPNDLVDRFPADRSESMTAVGMLARVFLGEDPKTSDAIQKGAALCASRLPRWDAADGTIDMYYWYYATLAMFQVGGDPWKRWESALKTDVVDRQRKDGDFCMARGSWDPRDPWGGDGGRVYSTACLAMCLEVWYRYEKVFGTAGEK